MVVTVQMGIPNSPAMALWCGESIVTVTAMPLLVSSAVVTVVPPEAWVYPLPCVTVWARVVASDGLPFTR